MRRSAAMLICCVLLLCGNAYALEQPDTSQAKSAILYEATTDTVLYESSADEAIIPASQTKMMTAILVIEHDPSLEGELTVTQEAIDYTSTMAKTHLQVGEVVGVRDCLSYMMVVSANEAASALACYVAGSVDAFVELMNEKAAEIGCENTHFSDPHGLSTFDHYTTARDLLTIARYAMQYEQFREIVQVKADVLPPSNVRTNGLSYATTNYVMEPGDHLYYQSEHAPYVKGIKTGSLASAGQGIACYMERDGLEFYSVVCQSDNIVMPDGEEYRGSMINTISMLDYAVGFAGTSVAAGETVTTLPVHGGVSESVEVQAESNVGVLYERGGSAEVLVDCPDTVSAPIRKGEVIGSITVRSDDGQERTAALVAAETVESSAGAFFSHYGLALGGAVIAVAALLLWKKKAAKRDDTSDHN